MTLRRVELVSAAEIAAAAIAPWFADAWAAMWGPEMPSLVPAPAEWLRGGTDERLIALIDGAPLALVSLRAAAGALEMSALAVAQAARNEGVGAEIVWQLEERAAAQRARAIFPHANGYAYYFWLRAGYHPVFAEDHRQGNVNVVERLLH